jgi:hypothetical protein
MKVDQLRRCVFGSYPLEFGGYQPEAGPTFLLVLFGRLLHALSNTLGAILITTYKSVIQL